MEKTIRELASELNISKEAIYRKVNRSMKNELTEHIIKKDGKTYISELGQSIICQSLKREIDEIQVGQETEVNNNVTNTDIDVSNKVSNTDNTKNPEYISFLEKQIDLLQTRYDLLLTRYDNEVSNNRQEREVLYQLNQSLIDTFNREQHLQYADKQLHLQDKKNMQSEHPDEHEPTKSNPQPKENILKRFFIKK